MRRAGPGGAGWVAAGLPCLVAAMTFGRVIDIGPAMLRVAPVVPLVVLAYAAADALSRRLSTRRWPVVVWPAVAGLLSTTAWAFLAGALTVPRDDAAVAAFGRGMRTGLRVILASPLPTLTVAETVVPAIMLTGTCTIAACWSVTTPRRATTLVASAGLFLLGLALGAGSSLGALALAVSYVVAAALALLLLGPWVAEAGDRDGPSPGRIVVTLLGIVLVGAMALGAGVLAPQFWTRAAFDPRTPTTAAQNVTIDIDPLDVATRWQLVDTTDDRPLLTLTADRAVPALTWVALEYYDGLSWRPGRAPLDLGRAVPPDRNAGASPGVDGRARLAVTDALPGTWLPLPYRPIDVIGGRVLVDPESATVLAVGSPAGRTYQVRYREVTPTRSRLATAGPAVYPADDPVRAYPQPFPTTLATFAAVAQRGRTGTFARMSGLAAALRAPRFRAATDAGVDDRTYRGLERVLATRAGTQEQYAALFVLMARASGVPARLVVGYRTPGDQATTTVTPRDVRVWGEAAIDGVGWVPFAASPQDRADGGLGVEVSDETTAPTPAAAATTAPSPAPSPSTAGGDAGAGSGLGRLLGGLLVLLALPVAVGGRAWWVRRRRALLRSGWRASADPRERAVGAWTFARAALADARLPLDPAVSPEDVAAGAVDLPDRVARPLREVAATAVPALYGPDPVPPAAADAAWAAADAVADAATATLTRRGRWQRAVRRPAVPPTGRVLDAAGRA